MLKGKLIIIVTAALLTFVTSTSADIANVTLGELINQSDTIVLGQVLSHRVEGEYMCAEIAVDSLFLGKATKGNIYVAFSEFTDGAKLDVDDKVIIFLSKIVIFDEIMDEQGVTSVYHGRLFTLVTDDIVSEYSLARHPEAFQRILQRLVWLFEPDDIPAEYKGFDNKTRMGLPDVLFALSVFVNIVLAIALLFLVRRRRQSQKEYAASN